MTTSKLHFRHISTKHDSAANPIFRISIGIHLPIRIKQRLARFDALLVRRQAVSVPVASLLLAGVQRSVGVGVGCGEVEGVVLVGDVVVVVRGWSWGREGEG